MKFRLWTLLLCPSHTQKAKVHKMIDYTRPGQTDDDHLYLEEVLGPQALKDVKTWNRRTLDRLENDPRFAIMQAQALDILNSKDKIPYVSYRAGKVHNFWQDADHVRGIWWGRIIHGVLSICPMAGKTRLSDGNLIPTRRHL